VVSGCLPQVTGRGVSKAKPSVYTSTAKTGLPILRTPPPKGSLHSARIPTQEVQDCTCTPGRTVVKQPPVTDQLDASSAEYMLPSISVAHKLAQCGVI